MTGIISGTGVGQLILPLLAGMDHQPWRRGALSILVLSTLFLIGSPNAAPGPQPQGHVPMEQNRDQTEGLL
jgi:hypothetical protein